MEDNSPGGMKVPLIVVGVVGLAVLGGILVRSGRGPAPAPEQKEPSEPVSALAPEPVPLPAPAPEASPEIEFSSLSATDASGANWTLGLQGMPAVLPEGCTKSGTPLVVKADVRGGGSTVTVGLIIQGQAGEVYEPGAAKNGRRMPAPTFKVFDEAGNEIGSGDFEYG